LGDQPEVTQQLIRQIVGEGPFGHLSDSDREAIIRELEAGFDITQRRGSIVAGEDHIPWLARRKPNIGFYYWNRLKNYYLETGLLPGRVVNVLDFVTDEILDFSGDPSDPGPWKKRGMVLGHVQSGKTTNYSALICKAADSGYKIIILLTGITNALRTQTQERVDETFIGKFSVFQAAIRREMPITRFGGQPRFPAYGTSRDSDFSTANARAYGVSLSALLEPMIFVTKKNKTTLDRLRGWLEQQNPGGLINHPLLLIDDEADNASINTSNRPDRVSAINAAIRDILALFLRSTYVGYTATPFANIFIDPDTEDEMLGHDLFPRNFIKALDPPSNYVGATRVFDEDGDLQETMTVPVDDFVDILPLRHKKNEGPDRLPPSLETAVRVFIISRAIRVIRGGGIKHSSMMINVSRFNDVQERIEGLVVFYLNTLRQSIEANAGLGDRGLRDEILAQMATDFRREFSDCGVSWSDVQVALWEAARPISVRTINMRGGVLDYSKNQEDGLHVIAIGGLALSRGLTLEGLTVSYILRNASASDTLMQMARWFGYRPGYEDLCRLYLPESSIDHYEFVNLAMEDLRTEIKRMERLNMTPKDFGLRVRHDPAIIQITAASKMRGAQAMTIAQDYSGRHVEGYRLLNSEEIFTRNRELVENLLKELGKPHEVDAQLWLWRSVQGGTILNFVKAFAFSPRHPDLGEIQEGRSLFSDYVSDRIAGELKFWDIAFPFNRVDGTEFGQSLEFRKFHLRSRKAGRVIGGDYFVTRKNRLANPGDERLGYPEAEALRIQREADAEGRRKETDLNLSRSRPLMIAHLFTAELAPFDAAKDTTRSDDILRTNESIASLSFCMPITNVEATTRTYAINQVYRQQLERFLREDDDDDAQLEERDEG
jgi:hypothetical protein